MNKQLVEVINISDNPIPAYETEASAGVDVRAQLDTTLILGPGKRALIKSGLSVAIPIGFEIQVRPRSGLAFKHGITVLNAPGTIDSDYRGDIGVILMNHGEENFTIAPGDRIAQLVLAPVVQIAWRTVKELSTTERGEGGFGSTGKS